MQRLKLHEWTMAGDIASIFCLFHDLLLRSYLYHCVWSVTTAHSFTPEKRDNNYSSHSLTPTWCLRNNIQYNWHLSQ